jgi:soluble lytic murein transglycosylase-like protein
MSSVALKLRRRFVVTAVVLWGLWQPASARAQIYTWKDAHGVLVLSSTPQGGHPTIGRPPLVVRVEPLLLQSLRGPYESLIAEHSTLQGVRPDLVRAVIQVESAFNRNAISPKGAMGLMQLMPSTAARFGVVNAFNPAENIRAGVGYLKQLLRRYENNEQLALAAYNAGPLAVDRYGSQVPPYRETQDYVHRVNALQGLQQAKRATPPTRIYRSVDIVHGRPVIRYSNVKPAGGNFQEVAR